MNIVVCLKQVPDSTEVQIDPATHTLIRQGIDNVLNPLDAYALEEAVALKQRYDGQVTALSMGPPQAQAVLRQALALGADRAILLCGMAFAGSDTWATATALAAAIRKLSPVDLILCGKQAVDGDTAQVGPAVAALLDLPQVTFVCEVLAVDNGTIRTRSLVENGQELLETYLPCLMTAVKDLNEPRIPTLDGQMSARRWPIETWDADTLNLRPSQTGLDGSPTRVIKIFPPATHKVTRKIESPEPGTLAEVAGFIKKIHNE